MGVNWNIQVKYLKNRKILNFFLHSALCLLSKQVRPAPHMYILYSAVQRHIRLRVAWNIKLLSSWVVFTGGFSGGVQTQAPSQLFLCIRSRPLSSLLFPQHSLTASIARPKMKRLTPRSLGSPIHLWGSSSIWGRRAGLRRCWGPLPRLVLMLRPAVLTPPCPWRNRGQETKAC